MTVSTPLRLGAIAAVAIAALTACGPGPVPTATEHLEIDGEVSAPGDTSGSGSGSAGEGPITADGLPVDGLLRGCAELVDESVARTEFDIQWTWEFVCTSRDAFDATVAALDAESGLTHTQNAIAGNESRISDWHHWIGEIGGQVVDVDAKLTGPPDDLEMTYLVTQRTDG